MITVSNPGMGLHERAEQEFLAYENARLSANLDYVAMMADVEIPTEDEEETDE